MKDFDLEIEAEDNEAEIVQQIIDLAAGLGWSFALQEGDMDDAIDHIIVGTRGALEEIDKAMDIYEIWGPPDEKKDNSVH